MKFKKRPVIVDAIQFIYTDKGIEDLCEFCGDALGKIYRARCPDAKAEAEILTLEDGHDGRAKHVATEGDWIVKGVEGEFYAVKPDIFEKTYEPVTLADKMECEYCVGHGDCHGTSC